MSLHNDRDRLRHMIAHAEEAVALIANQSRTDLDNDRMFELALTRLVEIVGEAAAGLSKETMSAAQSIPWSAVIGMRHKLIHGYFAVDRDILWNVAATDLPVLLPALKTLLAQQDATP